jgi:UDP-2,4-diacetamido-2,4,6-trideoxy-beta-L-altropyranose hydrolase
MRPIVTRQATVIADAGPAVGLGHLSRAGAAAVALRCHGFEVRALLCGGDARALTRDGISWTPMDGLPTEGGLTLVDSYLLDRDAFPALRQHGPVVAFVDPVGDAPDADVVIGNELDHPHALEALHYACLRPMFWGLEPPLPRDVVGTVLVSVGGSALAGGASLAAHVADALPGCRVRFVVGPHGSGDALPPNVEPVNAPPDLLGELLAADVVVSAAGQTMLEAACAGTPCVAIALVDNQRRQLAMLEAAGAVVNAEPESAAAAVEGLAGDASLRARLATHGRTAIDGYGALRLAWRLAALA